MRVCNSFDYQNLTTKTFLEIPHLPHFPIILYKCLVNAPLFYIYVFVFINPNKFFFFKCFITNFPFYMCLFYNNISFGDKHKSERNNVNPSKCSWGVLRVGINGEGCGCYLPI